MVLQVTVAESLRETLQNSLATATEVNDKVKSGTKSKTRVKVKSTTDVDTPVEYEYVYEEVSVGNDTQVTPENGTEVSPGDTLEQEATPEDTVRE